MTNSTHTSDNDDEYRRSLKDWSSYIEMLTQKIIEVDETIPELPVKDVVFRIYRDIRFSKDPTPYKVCAPYATLQINTNIRTGPLLGRLVPDGPQGPLRVLLRALRAGQLLHRGWSMAPGRALRPATARQHRRAAAAVAARADG